MTKRAKKAFDPKVFLATVNGGRSIAKYRMNQTVFSQGKPADAVFYIQKGKVKVTVVSEQGKEAVVAVLGPDEFCGEGCLTGQPLRLATATAMTECEIMRLEKATMIRVLHEEPAFSEMFVSHLLARTVRVEADLVDQLFNSSEKRLALLLLANFGIVRSQRNSLFITKTVSGSGPPPIANGVHSVTLASAARASRIACRAVGDCRRSLPSIAVSM
jgi:CRP/FNR family transcriptional regulator, cyclic AMP receptor protein